MKDMELGFRIPDSCGYIYFHNKDLIFYNFNYCSTSICERNGKGSPQDQEQRYD